MDETLALRARIERDELPNREGLQVDASVTSPRGMMLPFVGRRAELDRLHGAWERSGRGDSRIVLVGGEAGIGKSRLVAEFGQRVVAEGGRVVRGVTASRERIDYESLFDALRDGQPLLAAAKLDTRTRYALARLLPGLGFDSAPWSAGNDAPERDPQLLREALAQAFSALARRPLLIVLEDVQHAGPATLDVIAWLALRDDRSDATVWLCSIAGAGGAALSFVAEQLTEEERVSLTLRVKCRQELGVPRGVVAGEL